MLGQWQQPRHIQQFEQLVIQFKLPSQQLQRKRFGSVLFFGILSSLELFFVREHILFGQFVCDHHGYRFRGDRYPPLRKPRLGPRRPEG